MRAFVVAVVVAGLVTAGCSNKQTPGGGAPVTLSGTVNDRGTTDLRPAGATIDVRLEQDDFSFAPTFLQATPGASVKVRLENVGQNPHTFTIDDPKVDQEVQPDGNTVVTFTLPSSGVANFYCRFHRGSGMQGAFYFAAGSVAPTGGTSPADGGYGGGY